MYPTNLLHRGDKVEVVVEGSGGWLAIRPPEGSFSWVNTRFLQPVAAAQPVYVVAPEGAVAEVIIGSALMPARPNVVGTRLQRGAQLRSIGPGLTDPDGTWLPVTPPPGELRYVPAQAVAKTPPPAATQTAAAGASTFTAAAVAAPTHPPVPPGPDGLWRQAQQAERSGQAAEAIRLYRQAGTANVSVNPARSMEAFARADWLEKANRAGGAPGGFAMVSNPPAAGAADRLAPVPGDASAATVRLAPPNPPTYCPPDPPAAAPAADAANYTSSARGWLRRAGRVSESQRTYALDNAQGIPMYYVTGQPGVDLESSLNRFVEVFGRVEYRGDLRANYMIVARVQAAQ
jgi:hypothetical protein